MRKTLLRLLLAGSLGFNLFFAVGFVQSRGTALASATPSGKNEALADRLGLDSHQRGMLRNVILQTREQSQRLRAANQRDLDAIWAEFERPTPDAGRLHALMAAYSERQRLLHELTIDRVVEVARILTPGQRHDWAELARAKRPR